MNLNLCVKVSHKRRLLLNKTILVMKLIMLLITVACLQVSARTVAQSITLSEKNAPLTDAFDNIKKQTEYNFFWKGDDLSAYKVSVQVKNADIRKTMDALLNKLPLTYSIAQNTIVIQQKLTTPKVNIPIDTLTHLYTGHIFDDNGKPLEGATIIVKGTNEASVSILPDGLFERYATSKNILVVKYLGYAVVEYPLVKQDPNKPINIIMAKGTTDLQEVTVSTGYQDKDKETSTGSFEVITAKDLQHSTDPNLLPPVFSLGTVSAICQTPQIPQPLALALHRWYP
jgi:hypothetical protein